MKTFLPSFAPLLAVLLAAASCGGPDEEGSTSSSGSSSGAGGGVNIDDYLFPARSCAYDCPNDQCSERTTPYVCPALSPWAMMPHLAACPAWDGKDPAVVNGTCTATAPTGEALSRPGADPVNPALHILPDGRRLAPAGAEWPFDEVNIEGGTTSAIAAVPGTPYVLTLDTGNDDHVVRAVDTSKIGGGNPVTGIVKFSPPSYLNSGITVVPPGRAYVATDYGVVQALSFDPATGALARDDAASLMLPPSGMNPWYTASVAASPDGKRLVVTPVIETLALVYDIDPASPSYRMKLGQVDLGERETFTVAFDPLDGDHAYVTIWGGRKVIEIDLKVPASPVVSRSFATDRNPQGIAFLDARWMAVSNDFGETISIIDRITGAVTPIPVDFEPGLNGLDVSGLAYDPLAKRLYTVLSGINALAAYDVDLSMTPPKLTPSGRLPTSWWPSGITVAPDGSLTVINMRGHPIGPLLPQVPIGGGHGSKLMRGSVQHINTPTPADLTAGEAAVASAVAVGDRPGYSKVNCPGPTMDFPVPEKNTMGPSPVIKHVFFIVRENKTFDALLGDMPGVKGDPTLTMKATSAEMDQVWPNLRALGKTFAMSDNFYNLAIKSSQGHHWTTYGRTSDTCERTWSADPRPVPLCGVGDIGTPEEGSLFEWLGAKNVEYDILGEIVGSPSNPSMMHPPVDLNYPGGAYQNIDYNDLEKACYTAGRIRVACNLGAFVYMTLPNDHTIGVSPNNPSPETMCAINDEATGMLVDALSHSPLWASSLVVITEDDPQQGADHVDYHRTPLVLASPWLKRGYVSKAHIDTASLHKLFAHILGLPYPNLLVKNAGLPLDMFTSTPDYTPYTYKPHVWPIGCGTGSSAAEQELTGSWDFKEVDAQPGLGDQVMRWMRGQQLTELTPRLEVEIEARKARRAAGLPPERDDDD